MTQRSCDDLYDDVACAVRGRDATRFGSSCSGVLVSEASTQTEHDCNFSIDMDSGVGFLVAEYVDIADASYCQ